MKQKIWLLITISLIVLLALKLPLFLKKQLFNTHDLEYHAARTANYYLALKQGQIPPRWAPNLNYSFGFPKFLFTYPLPYMITTGFYLLTNHIELAINSYLFLMWLTGSLGMLMLARLKTHHPWLTLTTSLIYALSPFTLLNIFIRGALGELAFFALLPWVFYLLEQQNQIRCWWYPLLGLIIGSGFLLSHHPSLFVALPLIVIWVLIKFKPQFLKKYWEKKLGLILAISLISQFFWLPVLVESQYTVLNQDAGLAPVLNKFPVPLSLLWPKLGYHWLKLKHTYPHDFDTSLGLASLIIISITVISLVNHFFIKKTNQTDFKMTYFWLIVFILAVLLMLPISIPVWQLIPLSKFLQFPWRLLWLTTFSSCMLLLNLNIAQLITNKIFKPLLICLGLVSLGYWWFTAKPIAYIHRDDYEWLEYTGTATSFDEFMPKWFDHEKNLKIEDPVIVNSLTEFNPKKRAANTVNQGEVEVLAWNGTQMHYQVTATQSGFIIQRTAYFPGWEVMVNGQQQSINYNHQLLPGRILIPITAGTYKVQARFTNNTWARQLADRLSILGLGLGLAIVLLKPSHLNYLKTGATN
ncbi:MAG: hypothetical protein GF390_03180 [Candidatus Pacebacteria bacterium]|nr:hypothetical protein [Candidatus Paceibacterota bacterium]